MRTGLPILLSLALVTSSSCMECIVQTDCAVNAVCNIPEATCTCNTGFSGSGVDSTDFYRIDPPYSAHRYSSTLFGESAGGRHARGRYAESTETWSTQIKPAWMQIDLGEHLTIAGIDIRGGNNVVGWVRNFRVQVSNDGESAWEWVEEGRNFPGVTERRQRVRRMFAQPVQGRFVRIHVNQPELISMGAAAVIPHGCYSMCLVPGGLQCAENAYCIGDSCVCGDGFEGDGNCSDIDECTASIDNCDADAACGNTAGSFTCSCNTGYTGDGETCNDINECTDANTNTCHANATCGNIPGSFTCSCNAGFMGDGETCNDMDECLLDEHNCPTGLATCANTDGSFACTCNTGFIGTGLICSDIDECAGGLHNCDPDANYTCANRAGSFECECTGVCETSNSRGRLLATLSVVWAGAAFALAHLLA